MGATNSELLKLPDALLVRYFREGKIEHVWKVATDAAGVAVTVGTGKERRVERWTDLGGGLGFVPAE